MAKEAALTKDALKPSLTLHLRFDSHFGLKEHRFGICRARVTCPLSTDDANARVRKDWGLRKLYGLAKHLRQQRIAAGAALLPEPEVDVRVKDGDVALRRFEPNEPARLIAQELSILTNMLAGRLCVEHGLPAIYRVEDPCPEILTDPEHYDPVACHRQRRAMPRATLQTQPSPHRGLGVDVCAPIGWPYACYTDLLMHQQILSFLNSGRASYSEEDLRQAVLYTTYERATAREIEVRSRRYWLLRYLEEHVGGEVEAVVLERLRNGYLVELSEPRFRAFCPVRTQPTLAPGTRVNVRLTKVAPRADVIRLELTGSG